jgi:hypothetical protein
MGCVIAASWAWSPMNTAKLVRLWRKHLPNLEDKLKVFLAEISSPNFFTWCELLEVLKMLIKTALKNGYKVVCVNWVSST